jgi:hypothetical protein
MTLPVSSLFSLAYSVSSLQVLRWSCPSSLTRLACRCIQGVGIGFLGKSCQCAEILPESPSFGSLSPAGSTVGSTTWLAGFVGH